MDTHDANVDRDEGLKGGARSTPPTAELIQDLTTQRNILNAEKAKIALQIADVDGGLLESKARFEQYGTTSPPGWYREQKLRQAELYNLRHEINGQISDILAEIKRLSRVRLGDRFMDAARRILEPGKFYEVLSAAEQAVSSELSAHDQQIATHNQGPATAPPRPL